MPWHAYRGGSPPVVLVLVTVMCALMPAAPVPAYFNLDQAGAGGAPRARARGAGLGDVVVPGLLACLALRFDASRATDMRARAAAAADALQRAVGALGPGLADDAYMSAGADAAAAAYDGVADSEADARQRMQARRPSRPRPVQVGFAAGSGTCLAQLSAMASLTRWSTRAGTCRRGALGLTLPPMWWR